MYFSFQLKVHAKLPDGSEFDLCLNLFRSINPEACSFKVMSTKIEARLRKLDASSWPSLEAAAPPPGTYLLYLFTTSFSYPQSLVTFAWIALFISSFLCLASSNQAIIPKLSQKARGLGKA
jgi:hypothetical protein